MSSGWQRGKDIPVCQPPKDGSPGGVQVNNFINWCISQDYNAGKLAPSCLSTSDAAITCPSGFDLIGLGRRDELYNPNTGLAPLEWGGGVKILQGSAGGPCFSAAGVDNGNSTVGMLSRIGIHNIAFAARVGFGTATVPLSPLASTIGASELIIIRNALRCELNGVSTNGYLAGGVWLDNVWDSHLDAFTTLMAGWSDMTATADSANLQALIGRPFTALETLLGRSFGIAGIRISSPNAYPGLDISNNITLDRVHAESNACNGPLLHIQGNGNTAMISVRSKKLEAIDGEVPLIIAENVNGLDIFGWVYGAGTGKAPATMGGTASQTLYSTVPCIAPILLYKCNGVGLNGLISWNGQSACTISAFVRAIGSCGIYGNMAVIDGLAKITQAMLSVDAATTDYSGLKFHPTAYAQSVTGANLLQSKVV